MNNSSLTNGGKALKSGVWYVIGNFLAKSAGFITMPIFTRLLTKGEVGDFSNLVSWIDILVVIATLNLHSSIAVARFDFSDDINGFIKSNLLFGSFITIIIYLICYLFKEPFCQYTGLSVTEMNVAFLYLTVYPASQMLMIRSRIQYDYKVTILVSLLLAFSSTICSLIMTMLLSDRLLGRILGYFFPMIIINIVIFVVFFKNKGSLKIKYCKYSILIAVPYAWHTLAGSLLGSSDRVMIKYFCGNNDNALYSVAYYCALLISVFWAAVNNAFSPWAYEKLHDDDYIVLKRATRKMVVFMSVIVMLFLLIAPEILLLMGGKEYYSALKVIPPVMLAYVIQVVYSFYVNIEFYCKKQLFIAIGTSLAALVNIILNYIFLPILGYFVAAFTTLVGYCVLYMAHYIIVKKMGYSRFLDGKFYNVCLLICGLYMGGIYWLYEHSIIRLILIVALFIFVVVILILFRKEITTAIKKNNAELLINKIKKILKM